MECVDLDPNPAPASPLAVAVGVLSLWSLIDRDENPDATQVIVHTLFVCAYRVMISKVQVVL